MYEEHLEHLELNNYTEKCSEQIPDGNHCMLWNGFPRTANRIISQAQYWLIVSFSRRNWERELQAPGTFWREIKVVHLLRNASGERERCSEEVGTKEMKGESEERKDSSVYTFRPPRESPRRTLALNPFGKCADSRLYRVWKIICRDFPGWIPARFSSGGNTFTKRAVKFILIVKFEI